MTVTPSRPLAARVAAVLMIVPLLAACGSSASTSAPPSPSAVPTVATTPFPIPSYTLAPAPSGCPTTRPDLMPENTTATVTMKTAVGNIVIKVEANLARRAAGAFIALSKCGYYDNVIFHRVLKDQIIQGGDGTNGRMPLTTDGLAKVGTGGPGWTILDDKVTTKYTRGTIAMARTSEKNSGSSQFFFVLNDKMQDSLGASTANNYAIFGHVTPESLAVLDKIASVPVTAMGAQAEVSTPLYPIPILGTDVTQP